ncbi:MULTISPECIES: HAMP domain-containing sensor histidine kinase [Clostridia]|uniref:sensor histidine kinase n=1 Tax=Clostridia TaxID=186801 RepID=UPI000EA21CD5|nr:MULTISPECIES: HAMP domain-containing sensor histidine kinase [Clostridia]NBJ70680.1 sensor histidine kinase [Roseburia sp. 1XD42-34]RKI75909.1 sensor histidine kinase [Clostridium sp. 1xD42-85]
MNSIKRRIAIHFSLQFILMILLVTGIILLILFVWIKELINYEIHGNYPNGMLDAIVTETVVDDNHTVLPEKWMKKLREKNMWLQIINKTGVVIYEENTPKDLPNQYSLKEIINLDKQKTLGEYQIATLVDSFYYNDPYYFVLGYQDETQHLLTEWGQLANEGGSIKEEHIPKLQKEVESLGGYLDIVKPNGDVIRRIGKSNKPMKYDNLQITAQLAEPSHYGTSIHVTDVGNNLWVLHSTLDEYQGEDSIVQKAIFALICVSITLLIFIICLSIWHGIRYGQPLLLFISWLERMKNGQFEKVFTEKEKQKLFTKKNQIKRRFRLYREVIDEIYDMADQFSSLEKERVQLERKRDEWMAGVSHDLRTPLSTIQGYAHLLESAQYQWNDTELKEIGEVLRVKSDYMLNLVEDFSFITRLKEQKGEDAFSSIDIKTVLTTCQYKYKEYKNIHISLPSQSLLIRGKEQWLERLLDNLIMNAEKHNPPNTQITVTATSLLPYVVIIVEDNGIGMDDETKQNLFTRYYRGTSSAEQTAGSGLGMSIAKAIVEAHNGFIEVSSQLQKGTLIKVKIPSTKI